MAFAGSYEEIKTCCPGKENKICALIMAPKQNKTKNLSMKERTVQCSTLLQFGGKGVVSITAVINLFLW